jgi:hypothetical protein
LQGIDHRLRTFYRQSDLSLKTRSQDLSTAVGEPWHLTFRGLSTCIDLRSDYRERFQALPVICNWLRNVAPSNDLSPCQGWFISKYFYRHDAAPKRERRDHLIVIASGACLSTSDSHVDFQTHPRKQTFINSRIQP